MAKWKVPVVWIMTGHVIVEAEDAEKAEEKAEEEPLPEGGEYLSDSFQVDGDEETVQVDDEGNELGGKKDELEESEEDPVKAEESKDVTGED